MPRQNAQARDANPETADLYGWLAGRRDALLDEALKQTFPASDPVSFTRVE